MKTHPVHVTHLVFGLVFLGIAGAWVLRTTGVVDAGADRWIFPADLLLAGGAGLVASVTKSLGRRSSGGEEEEEPYEYDPYGAADEDPYRH
jgi:hypothetical protein